MQVLSRPDLRDYYPTASLVNREEGSVRVRICFDDKGRVTGTTVNQSSGFPRLDEAGLRAAQKYRIKPGTLDGVPQAACAVVPMVFMVTGKPIAP
jgi:periplasmic protein TonB